MKNLIAKYFSIPKYPNRKKEEASLLELFFDLVFVAFIGAFVHRVTGMLEGGHEKFTWFSFLFVVLTLISVILVWRQFTVYSSRYEVPNNYRHRIFTLIIMIGIAIVTTAMFIPFGETHSGHSDVYKNFNRVIIVTIPGYFLIMVPLTYLHISVAFKSDNKYERRRQIYSAAGIGGATLIVTPASIINIIYNDETIRWIAIGLWTLMIVVWMTFSWLSSGMKISVNTVDTSLKHLQDRFAVIFIVFIGESIIQVIEGSTSEFVDNTTPTVLKLTMILLVLFSWWWWFNDTINFPDIVNHPRKITLYKSALIFILVSLAFSAVGFKGIIESPSENWPKWMLASGMLIWSVANSIIFVTLKNYNKKAKVLFPKFLRTWIYCMPAIMSPIIPLAILDAVSTQVFFYITFGFSMLLIPLSISLAVYKLLIKSKEDNALEETIKKYYIKERKWIKKSAAPYLDKEIHERYEHNLNHYSEYCK